MSYYGGMGMSTGGGSQQQMLSLSSSLLLLCGVAGAAYMYLNSQKSSSPSLSPVYQAQPAIQAPVQYTGGAPQPVAPISSGQIARNMDGRYRVTYGGLGLTVDPADCKTRNVWFSDTTSGAKHEWNLRLVPGYEDVYTLRSEDRTFNKGCDAAYLEAPSSCSGPAYLNRPVSSDLQYWQLVPSTDGGYELRNVACFNKRWPAYMISSGNQEGVTNTARLADRGGSPYLFKKV